MTEETKENKPESKPKISYEDFQKIEIKIGEIKSAERIEKSDKLLLLAVDFGEKTDLGEPAFRTVVSGIGKYFADVAELVGKKFAFVTNLEPRPIMGIESQAMILAASTENEFAVLSVGAELPAGAKVK